VSSPSRVFAGWWVVAGAFVCMLTGYTVAYSFAAFFGPLEAEFGAQRGETSLVFSISAFLYFLLGLPAGLIADRLGPRPVVAGGLLVISLGLVLAAEAGALWQVYLGYSLGVGLGVGFSYVPSVAAVQRWFVRRRGAASGLAVAGIGVGTLIGAPLAHELIATIGWRKTYLVLACIAVVGAVVAGLLIRPPPQRYGLGPEVLRDLNFKIPAHSFQFLTGPSGAGKTSLLRMLFLSLRPTRGLVNLFGQDVSLLSKDAVAKLRSRIGIVLQDFRLLDHMTTYENVALPFRVMGREESSYRKEVIDLLKWVGLGDRMDALPPILSGGEKQRAAIARAVIGRPALLLADEPTGNVDPTLARRLLTLFIQLNKTGTAVIIATHDIALMDQYEARRMVLHEGRLHIYE